MPADGVDADKAKPEKRVALVIGNGAYANATPLGNPPNDAPGDGRDAART